MEEKIDILKKMCEEAVVTKKGNVRFRTNIQDEYYIGWYVID